MALTPETEISQPVPGAPTGSATAKQSSGMIVRQMMDNPQNFMQLMRLMLLAFTNPEALKNQGLENSLAGILGFDDVASMNQWRDNSGGSFLQAIKGTNWDKIDTKLVDQEYHKYAKLADSGNPLLEMIGKHEAGGNYNIAYGGKNPEINGKPLTECSIGEVRKWQDQYVGSGSASSAVGKYQIIRGTMDGLVTKLAKEDGISKEDFMKKPFDEAMQDRMAVKLMEQRGLDKFIDGKIDEKTFMRNLSQEWASLPKDASGRSYYAGDGLNKALVSPEGVLGAMKATKETLHQTFARAEEAETPLQAPAEPQPAKSGYPAEFQTAALNQPATADKPAAPAAETATVAVEKTFTAAHPTMAG